LFACGSKEGSVFVIRFGGKAAKTNEINVFSRPAGACPERSRMGRKTVLAVATAYVVSMKTVFR
jgi:hypothetical protein